MKLIKKISPLRLIVLGFAFVILLGAVVLSLPISVNKGVDVSFLDALFTSTSAVCVTGLIVVDTADTYSNFGISVVAILIQIGGLGVSSVGVGIMMVAHKRIGIKGRVLVKEAMNLYNIGGAVGLVKRVLFMTLIFESFGVLLSFFVFIKDYSPLCAIKISFFHSIASFNNAGFDIMGGFKNMIGYEDNILLNLTTCFLIISGGIGFLVIGEIIKKHSFKKFTLHTKIVLTMTGILLVAGTVLLKLTENMTWLEAFFHSTSARTAGFMTVNMGSITNAGLLVIIVLMFFGASPGSTGGGIKTTTVFVLIKSAYSYATNKHCTSFKRKISNETISKSFIIALLAVSIVVVNSFLLCIIEPEYSFIQILFEVVSAFGTVGLSTGITPELSGISKVIIIITMFIGRLGPLTMASIWSFNAMPEARYSEENVMIG